MGWAAVLPIFKCSTSQKTNISWTPSQGRDFISLVHLLPMAFPQSTHTKCTHVHTCKSIPVTRLSAHALSCCRLLICSSNRKACKHAIAARHWSCTKRDMWECIIEPAAKHPIIAGFMNGPRANHVAHSSTRGRIQAKACERGGKPALCDPKFLETCLTCTRPVLD